MRPRSYISRERTGPLVEYRSAWPREPARFSCSPIEHLIQRIYLRVLVVSLAGYALFDKAFAYVGLAPLYIGELVLFLGLVALMLSPSAISSLFRSRSDSITIIFIVLLCLWGACRTFPYIPDYGIAALRDGVSWAYSAFALIAYGLLCTRPHRLVRMLKQYAVFARYMPYLVLPLLVLWVLGIRGPKVGDNVYFVTLKAGDLSVHMAGACLAYLLGITEAQVVLWPLATLACMFVLMVQNRGGALAFLCGTCIAAIGRVRVLWKALALVVAGGLIAVLADTVIPKIQLFERRELSAEQAVTNLKSIFVSAPDAPGGVEGTKRWRLLWWSRIIEYTVHGEYFWTGKGFGPNIAVDDGFASERESRLRSPHNSHLTFLARGGVPGAVIWIGLQLSWAWTLARAHHRARARKMPRWSQLFLFLLGYWVAFNVNACFDVFLEGPMGGVWYWTIVGFGLAAAKLSRTHPGLLEPALARPSTPQRAVGSSEGGSRVFVSRKCSL